MAVEAQNTMLYWSTDTSVSTASQEVGDVISFSGPSGSAGVIDITNLQSTAKEKLLGLRDEGQLSMELICDPADAGQVALRVDRATRTKRGCALKLSDTAVTFIGFKGYCSGYSVSGAVDDKVSLAVTIEITGAVAFSTVAA